MHVMVDAGNRRKFGDREVMAWFSGRRWLRRKHGVMLSLVRTVEPECGSPGLLLTALTTERQPVQPLLCAVVLLCFKLTRNSDMKE